MAVRFGHYQTALFPIWNAARVHAVFIKRHDRISQATWDEGKQLPTALKKAEKRIHDELLERGYKHCGPEWFNCSVNETVTKLALFHYGSLDPPEAADGHNCEAYMFSPTEMIRLEDDYVNIAQLAEPKQSARPAKLTEKMKESKKQEAERSRKKTKDTEPAIQPVTDAVTVTALQARLHK
jgi:hypothetical protein